VSESEGGDPPDHVVGEACQHCPCGVGVEVAGRAVDEPGTFFEVPDGQFDDGMATMVFVQGDRGSFEVADERVVAPRGEQLGLLADQARAAHDEAMVVAIGGFGHFGLAAERVGDRRPVRLVDRLDGPDHGLVEVHGDRVADVVVTTGGNDVLGVERRVGPKSQLARCPGPAHPTDRLTHETLCPSAGVRRTLPMSDVEDLAGVGPGRNQRVLSEHARVAVSRALLLSAIDLLDGRVDVDGHRLFARTGAERPGPRQQLPAETIELADVPESEAPEERSQRGRRHHLVAQDPLRRTRPQHIAVVDALGAGDNGMNQREDLAPGNSVSWNVTEVDHLIGQVEGPEPVGQRGDQGQPRTGHRPVIVEGHCKTSRTMRFCVHRKDAFLFWLDVDFSESHLPSTGGIFREWSSVRSSDHTGQFGGSRLNEAFTELRHIPGASLP